VTIDGISVQETIDLARNQLAQINVPEDNKSSIELLINLTSIMKDRLGINSSNSSKPPSKDDPKDKCQKDKRPASERSVGGQKGHQGSQLELVENPDDIIYIPIDKGVIPDGNHFISGYARRQVIDIKISRHIIEYRAEILSNEDGKTITAEFPSDVGRPAQYGASVKAHSVYMSLYQLIPYKRVAEHFNDLNFPYFHQAANLIIRFNHKDLLFFCRFVSFLQTRSLLYRSTSNFLA
jgi:transposase